MDEVKFTYQAPPALVAHCSRRSSKAPTGGAGIGVTDPSAIRELVEWMVDNSTIETYDDWISVGMICALEAGDAGLDIWALTCHNKTADDGAMVHWRSFATDAAQAGAENLQKIGSLLHKAKQGGWKGHLRSSAQYMFRAIAAVDVFGKPVNVNPAPVPNTQDTVAAIAQAAGATLAPPGAGAIPLMDTQRIVAALGQPVLDEFMAGTSRSPSQPQSFEYPKLPETLAAHPLFELVNDAIERLMAMAECAPKQFRQGRVLPTLAVLYAIHPDICDRLFQRLIATGAVISPASFDSAVKSFENKVRREVNTSAGFILDTKGNPAPDNSDNVCVFVRQDGKRLRYNIWRDIAEVADAERDNWTQLSDAAIDDFLVRAENSQYNYHPSKDRFRRGLLSMAREAPHDPVIERIDRAAAAWDSVPRLDQWLHHTCGVPNDAYHRVVGGNIVGGMIRRARHPGCKHDECAILISPDQGKGKSEITKILAMDMGWHTDTLKLGGRQQDMVPQMAGKWIIELSELAGMSKTETEDVKAFISTQTDNYTKKYEAFAGDHPRRCVFIGTSNNKRPLQDDSGNRRFLPVHVVGEANLEWLRANIEQIIGECAVREANGDTFRIPRELWDTAAQHQEAARHIAPIEELISEWFDRPSGSSYYITASDLNNALKLANVRARYSSLMDKLGWRYENLTLPMGGRQRLWIRHHNNNVYECLRLIPMQPQPNRPVEMRAVQTPLAGTMYPPPY